MVLTGGAKMLSFSVPLTYMEYCDKLHLNSNEESSKERYKIYYRRFVPKCPLPDKRGEDDASV
jgi:hypothetical protein